MDFRSEVFKLCKAIQKRAETNIVNETYLRLFTSKSEECVIPQYSMFHEAAKHGNNQFYGYLYANEHTDDYKTVLQGIKPLPDKDIQIFARAHATIYALIKECVKELEISNPRIAKVLDPYSKYRPITAPAGVDFEEEYRPIDLNFGLTDGSFDIYQHQKNNENIHLYEMGSGANWVSCHIALFLSFLRFFATQDNSPMPLFMFFDQPSQVYFPQGNDKDEITQADLMAVNKMYKTIFDEINSIGEDTERLPQIIIVDHVDGKSLKCKEEFEKYVCCNWRNNTALI